MFFVDCVSVWFEKILKGKKSSFHFANVNHGLSWILEFKSFDLVEDFMFLLKPLKMSARLELLLTETQVGSGLRDSFTTSTL